MKMVSQIPNSRRDIRIRRLSTGIGVKERRREVSVDKRCVVGIGAVSRDAAQFFQKMIFLRMLLFLLANKHEWSTKQNGLNNYVRTANQNEFNS